MIHLHVYGDGPRDGDTVPGLVESVLGVRVQATFLSWAHLHEPKGKGRGYQRKLRFAVLQARNAGASGVVATVDRDKDRRREKLSALREGREEARQSAPPFPTALGEADPHGDVWLLDDPVALRQALQLDPAVEIPSIRHVKSPKDALDEFLAASFPDEPERPRLLPDIARLVQVKRCSHRKETGFQAFVEEIEQELTPLAQSCGPGCSPDAPCPCDA